MSLQQMSELLSTKYSGWRVVSVETVPSQIGQIINSYHSGVFLFVKLEKEQDGKVLYGGFTITDSECEADRICLFDYEQSLRWLFWTDYEFNMENETEARIYEEMTKEHM